MLVNGLFEGQVIDGGLMPIMVIRGILAIGGIFYAVYSLIILNQIRSMNKTISCSGGGLLFFLSGVNFLASLVVGSLVLFNLMFLWF